MEIVRSLLKKFKQSASHADALLPIAHKPDSLFVYRHSNQMYEECNEALLQEHFGMSYLHDLHFEKEAHLQWVQKRCQQCLCNELLRKQNAWKINLYEDAFSHKRLPKFYIKWVDPFIGYGLFAFDDLPQYTWIGEYVGVVRKRSRKMDRYNDYIFGYVTANEETSFVVDAKEYGNHTRFINHSDESNLCSAWMILNNVCHIILTTRYRIPKNTQLTYDYGPHYWKKRTPPFTL